ncbi:MAG TPA: sugar-binding protein [Candidatus Thiothrix moscowensis]|uniref:sugar-binding protein n=1 Tax=unclassified Thiothrix TaxID=2636184 RepID=UPI0025DB5212|nr:MULTISPECIES: sugar-binding protein [unclassified Thiothrix]HRJ53699.1 sugar-binding protein [Candidatus Thiothrix moscowensis]HRJ93781.1 sugar-binding protein [Candidatus Thiothrix moscowensis]
MTKVRCFGGSRLLASFILLLGLAATHSASAFYNSNSPLGTNTNEIMDDDSSAPFIDLMKMSLPFREARQLNKGDIQYDRYGWPTRISAGGQAATRFVSKLPAGTIPPGPYTVLYEGEGVLEYGNDAKLRDHRPGRDVIILEPGQDNELNATLFIKATNPANPIRNIRILPPGGICSSNPFQRVPNPGQCRGDFLSFEENSDKIIFNPDYLNYMKDFRVIRFMNMSGITRNPVYAWEDRASIDQATWGGVEGIRGAPMEVMVELANRLHADPWFSLPHAASDDFIRRFAEYVQAHLDPTLKVYVEYTNEAWNGIFTQHAFVKQRGLAMGLDTDPNQAAYKYYSKRSVEVFRVWESVFGGDKRLVRVMSGLIGSTQMTKTILSFEGAYRFTDAYAVAPYVYGDLNALRQARSVNDVFNIMTNPKYPHSLPNEINLIRKQAEVTTSFGLDLLAYEGGQHLVDMHTKSDDQHPNTLFYQANRHPQMAAIYQQLLQGWKQAGGKLFVHFSSPRIYRKYGSFGTKEFITQAESQAPKHQALLGFSRNNPCWWSGCSGNTLVRHTKPATTLEAMKSQSEPLDATAPQHESVYGEAPPFPMGNMTPEAESQASAPAQEAAPQYSRILVSMQNAPNEQYVMGGNAVIRRIRDAGNVWQGASTYQLRTVVNGQIDGKSDLAALWQGSWDTNNLYLRIGVEDDHESSDSRVPWEDDAIEVYLDADGSSHNQYDGQNDFHFIISRKDGRVALGKNSPATETMPMNSHVTRSGNGYVVEMTLPWDALRIQPRTGMRIGLDVHISDDDDGDGRDGKLTWKARQDEAWRDPSIMGKVILGE